MRDKNRRHASISLPSARTRLPSWKRRSVLLLITGIVVGQFTYHIAKALLRRGQHIYCTLPPSSTTKGDYSDSETSSIHDGAGLLFIGVMTSRRYLRTRARAIQKTWGSVQGGSLVFFVGKGDEVEEDLPVQILEDVVDSEYPPQRKSFAMLEFMHRKFGQKYEWFMRADDDLFVDVRRLRTLLSSINSSRPVYLGHPGTGKPEERGKLGLPAGSAYCMGGTGVLLSRAMLGMVAGGLHACLDNKATDHEDSELGRCVHNITGVSCVQSPQIFRQFKQNYDDTSGEWIRKALQTHRPYVTFHPLKDTRYMYFSTVLHDTQRVSELQTKVRQLQASADCIEELLVNRVESYGNEPKHIVCLHGNCSNENAYSCKFGEQRKKSVSFDGFANVPWFLIHGNTFFTLWKTGLRKPANSAGVSEGVSKALRHLSNYVTAKGRQARQVAVDLFYRRLIPGVGVEYVTFLRDASSSVRPYVIRETFDDLIPVEKQQVLMEATELAE